MLLSSEQVYQSRGNSSDVDRIPWNSVNVTRIYLKRQSQRSLEFACARNLVYGDLTEVVAIDAQIGIPQNRVIQHILTIDTNLCGHVLT